MQATIKPCSLTHEITTTDLFLAATSTLRLTGSQYGPLSNNIKIVSSLLSILGNNIILLLRSAYDSPVDVFNPDMSLNTLYNGPAVVYSGCTLWEIFNTGILKTNDH